MHHSLSFLILQSKSCDLDLESTPCNKVMLSIFEASDMSYLTWLCAIVFGFVVYDAS